MMMRKLLFTLMIGLFQMVSNAQQLPIFSDPEMLSSLVNPSKLSSEYYKYGHNVSVNAIYRHQWVELEDAPRSFGVNFNYFSEENNISFGGSLINDQTGKFGFTGLSGKAAYLIRFNQDLALSIGLSGGINQYRVKAAELNFLEGGDIASQNETKFFPDFSMGATVYFQEKYFIGISTPQSFGFNLNFQQEENNFNLKRIRHYFATAGAHLPMADDNWLDITAWARYVYAAPIYYGIHIKKEFLQSFWIGAGIGSVGDLSIEAGIKLSPGFDNDFIHLGYFYGNYFNSYGSYFGTTHELKVSYTFDY